MDKEKKNTYNFFNFKKKSSTSIDAKEKTFQLKKEPFKEIREVLTWFKSI